MLQNECALIAQGNFYPFLKIKEVSDLINETNLQLEHFRRLGMEHAAKKIIQKTKGNVLAIVVSKKGMHLFGSDNTDFLYRVFPNGVMDVIRDGKYGCPRKYKKVSLRNYKGDISSSVLKNIPTELPKKVVVFESAMFKEIIAPVIAIYTGIKFEGKKLYLDIC